MATLHKTPATLPIEENRISSADKRIRSYIEKHGDIVYDSVISEETDWQVFYNLSELRTGILSWYDFGADAQVLEIGAGFGALTGRLCKMCAHVTATERSLYRAEALAKRYEAAENLDIYAADVAELEFDRQFDYIVLVGLLERVGGGSGLRTPYVKYLEKLRGWLKPGGKLLAAVENRYGLRYFCGAREPHTNHAFDGINRYMRGTPGYSFDRRELEEVIKAAGFAVCRFYYPLPDYKLPQLIYSDEYLPERNIKERLIPYYRNADTLVANELELYDDIAENGVFPFFANSFLAECGQEVTCESVHRAMSASMQGMSCDHADRTSDGTAQADGRNATKKQIIYAALSTDRGESGAYATVIRRDGTVRKQPLYEKGRESAKALYENISDLKQRGIPVVEHSFAEDSALELPYIAWPTLSNYIKTIIRTEPERMVRLLDRIYEYVLQSSEQVPATENALLARLPEEAAELDFGPILRKTYIELMQLNCFCNPETEELLFFDQEFVRENYPAKYVLFRAISYIYWFTPGADACYPMQKLVEKYGMVDVWQYYLEEEERLQDEVKNREQYQLFYRWTKLDGGRMLKNAERLEEQGAVAEYKVSEKMRRTWDVELEILDAVDALCKKHGLRYYLVHGSLLGAVRHRGFIPWDDDLDIAMPRADYDRFLKLAASELEEPLSLHTPETEGDIFWGGYARVKNGATTAIEPKEIGHRGNLGVWVDVLPMDACPVSEKEFRKKEKRISRYQRLLYAKIYGRDFEAYAGMKPWKWRIYRLWAVCYSHAGLCRKLSEAQRCCSEASDEVTCFSGLGKHKRFRAADFQDTVLLEFEGRRVPAPCGYENYLFALFGGDYMKYPPEEERKPKHRGIYHPEKPYAEYVKLLCDTFEGAKRKQIILFGAGLMFEDYMKKYGDRYRPAFLLDNDANKWGRYRMGIEIRKPEEILKVPAQKRHLIICSFYYREISTQLDAMGVTDYKVYVQEPEWILQTEERQE